MRPPRFRRKPTSHGESSLLRYLFPHTRQRVRDKLSQFRYESLPKLKHRTQAGIYRYIVYRQAQKLKKKKSGILQQLRRTTNRLLGSNNSYLENEARARRQKLLNLGKGQNAKTKGAMSYRDGGADRAPGTRRRKLAGYLKAANELRQVYTEQYAPEWTQRGGGYEYDDPSPGEVAEGGVIRSGEEEMILFPSYARKHVKRRPESEPGTIQEVSGDGRDVRDTTGAGDAEFWKQRWQEYEDDNAIVDVDVRGWIYSPHKGQMSRKQRLFVGLARKLVGIEAPTAGTRPSSASPSAHPSRSPSPGHLNEEERRAVRQAQKDDILTAKEAEEILRRGEKEAEIAAKGGYSERPTADDSTNSTIARSQSKDSLRTLDTEGLTPPNKRGTWSQPADMTQAEIAEANARLMARLRHFLAIPAANSPVSIFFYNDKVSKQRTIYTDAAGHFSLCAALDFVPSHVRILASPKLSATEEVTVTDAMGVSVISDIDDTIKHSAISSGAREIFRNAFIRDLGDLTIDGVREWYNRMAEMGVKFHYVSNSPWQLFPVISKYFAMAGLPPGSFHLKQYSGMFQGIFEPVAERKKGTLDKIARDFPERRFILVGDSGEADLEVYTDFVLENPGRVVAVFIRDVTTPETGGFFDPSIGPMPGDRPSPSPQPQRGGSNAASRIAASPSNADEENDPQLKAAIQASLRELNEDEKRRSRSLFPTLDEHNSAPGRPYLPPRRSTPPKPVGNLIDLESSSDDEGPEEPLAFRRTNSDNIAQRETRRVSSTSRPGPPPPNKKPEALRSTSNDLSDPPTPSSSSPSSPSTSKAPPLPPKPRRLSSSSVNRPSPLSQMQTPRQQTPTQSSLTPQTSASSGPVSEPQQSYSNMALNGLSTVYNHLPTIRSTTPNPPTPSTAFPPQAGASGINKRAPPPPPPPRRGVSAYPVAAVSYVGGKAVSAWQNAPHIPHPTIPGRTAAPGPGPAAYSTSSNAGPNRDAPGTARRSATSSSSSSSALGMSGPQPANHSSSSSSNDAQSQYPPGMPKREIMWRQRWARAEQVLGERGVKLRSWRVGRDVVAEAERLISEAMRKEERKVGTEGESELQKEQRKGDGGQRDQREGR